MNHIFPRPLIVIDTETTGLLDDPEATVWEIGAVLLGVDGTCVGRFDACGFPPIMRSHHVEIMWRFSTMTPTWLLNRERPIAQVAREFVRWMSMNEGSGGVDYSAFNVHFDSAMLARVGVNIPLWSPCIMERAKADIGPNIGAPGSRLERAARFYGVEVEAPSHRALSDAVTAGRVAVAQAQRGAR